MVRLPELESPDTHSYARLASPGAPTILDQDAAKSDQMRSSVLATPLAPSSSDESAQADAEPNHRASPEQRADRVVAHWSRSGEQLIACAVEVLDDWNTLSADPDSLRVYGNRLAAHGFLTEREAADPQGSAKLSSMRKIAQQREVLQHDEILALVGPRYTCLTICARICDQLAGEFEERQSALLKVLRSCPNEELDRAYLQQQLARVKNSKDKAPPDGEQSDDDFEEHSDSEGEESSDSTTWKELQKRKTKFDRVLITLRPSDKRLMMKGLADPDQVKKQLPIKTVLARDAVVIVPVETADLPVVCEMAKNQGLRPPAAVLLACRPAGPNIAAEQVLVVFRQGRDVAIATDAEALWAEDGHDLDAVQLAARVSPGGHWLHVFADGPHEGHTTLVGDDGWLDAPEN